MGIGAEPVGSTPEQFGEHLKSEVAKWASVIKANRIEMQQW
jgi:tripartite-type tricarboxylate transporter receptor subunit TctC